MIDVDFHDQVYEDSELADFTDADWDETDKKEFPTGPPRELPKEAINQNWQNFLAERMLR